MSDPKTCPHCGEDHNGVTGCRPKVSTNYNRWLDIASKAGVGTEPEPKPATEQRQFSCKGCGESFFSAQAASQHKCKPATETAWSREWWVYDGENDTQRSAVPVVAWNPNIPGYIRVVEASRLEKAERELSNVIAAHDTQVTIAKQFQEIFKQIEPEVSALSDKLTAANQRIAELSAKLHAANMDFRRYSLSEVDNQLSAANQRIEQLEQDLQCANDVINNDREHPAIKSRDAWRSAALRLREAIESDSGDIIWDAATEFDAFVAREKK